MAGLNNCTFYGRIGKIETRYVGSDNKPVSSISLAVDSREKVNGQWEKVTTWCSLTLWGNEGILNYLTVGKEIGVTCRYKQRKYEKDGQQRTSHEFVVDQVALGGGKESSKEDAEPAFREPRSMPRSAPKGSGPSSANDGWNTQTTIDDSDLPF